MHNPVKEKPVAIVLGGTNPHKALIENLKTRGYYTVLVDYLDNPPAKESADEHIKKSALDKNVVLSLATKYCARLVISVALEKTIPIVAYVSEKLNLPSIYTEEIALKVTDKTLMKSVFIAHNIPTPNHISTNNLQKIDFYKIELPVVIKPSDGTGSIGVSIIRTIQQFRPCFELAQKTSQNGFVIIEDYIDGKELSVDCFIINGEAHVLMVRERLTTDVGKAGKRETYATITLVDLNNVLLNELQQIAQKVASSFKVYNAPLLIQGFLTDRNNFCVLEVALRLGGGLSSFRTVKLKTGFDILSATVNCNLGVQNSLVKTRSNDIFVTINVYASGGVLDKVIGIDDLINRKTVSEFYQYKFQGYKLDSFITARNRVFSVILKSRTYTGLQKKIKLFYTSIDVLNTNGESIILKNIGFFKENKI